MRSASVNGPCKDCRDKHGDDFPDPACGCGATGPCWCKDSGAMALDLPLPVHLLRPGGPAPVDLDADGVAS